MKTFTGNMAEELFIVVIVNRLFVLLFLKYRFRHRYRFKSSGLAPVSKKEGKKTIPIPSCSLNLKKRQSQHLKVLKNESL